jgi:hypothetical protein
MTTLFLFDHKAWLAAVPAGVLDPSDIDKCFEYVLRNHPLSGVATVGSVGKQELLALSIEEAAGYADAVTVFCCEALSPHQTQNLDFGLDDFNDTALGNLAFIAVNHSDAAVRARCRAKFLELKVSVWKP